MTETTATRTKEPRQLEASEAWTNLETEAFYEGMKNGASPLHRSLRTAQGALLQEISAGDTVQASSVAVTVHDKHGWDGQRHEHVIATEDGKVAKDWAWCEHETAECGAEEIYYEDLATRAHGWICKSCRKIRQTG